MSFKVGDLVTPRRDLELTVYKCNNLSCVQGCIYKVTAVVGKREEHLRLTPVSLTADLKLYCALDDIKSELNKASYVRLSSYYTHLKIQVGDNCVEFKD